MTITNTIAIDGPAASGKSTLGKKLAQALDYLLIDTGLMYRAVTWIAIKNNIDLLDEHAISTLAENTKIEFLPPSIEDGRDCDIIADGIDITWQIRSSIVDQNVSLVSSYEGVRNALSDQQRRLAQNGKVVMVGRDIGTVVIPEAKLKIFLDASVEERAWRRYVELKNRGEEAIYEEILEGMRKRDQFDSNREIAPLRPADDAEIISSDNMTAKEVFEKALELSNLSDSQSLFKDIPS
jgi:cytidylate kinase